MKRRDLAHALLVGAGTTLVGCTKLMRSAHATHLIAVIPKGRTHHFWRLVREGAAEEPYQNHRLIWNGPQSETDSERQVEIFNRMVGAGVQAVAIAPIDMSFVAAAHRARAQGVKVVVFDSPVDDGICDYQVTTHNRLAGELAGNRLAKILRGHGSVVMITGQPGSSSTREREEGFKSVLRSFSSGAVQRAIEVVAEVSADANFAKALVATRELVSRYRPSAIFASNESATAGAMHACMNSIPPVRVLGFDWNPDLLAGLRRGHVDSLVIQDPRAMGRGAVRMAHHLCDGGRPPENSKEVISPLLVTARDLDKAEIVKRIEPSRGKTHR